MIRSTVLLSSFLVMLLMGGSPEAQARIQDPLSGWIERHWEMDVGVGQAHEVWAHSSNLPVSEGRLAQEHLREENACGTASERLAAVDGMRHVTVKHPAPLNGRSCLHAHGDAPKD
jgi:hypothetical protein